MGCFRKNSAAQNPEHSSSPRSALPSSSPFAPSFSCFPFNVTSRGSVNNSGCLHRRWSTFWSSRALGPSWVVRSCDVRRTLQNLSGPLKSAKGFTLHEGNKNVRCTRATRLKDEGHKGSATMRSSVLSVTETPSFSNVILSHVDVYGWP
ncbi:hypothetical protein KM043_012511 [Ampulex compressa]|nr:hypothetical protein KM043_012511 [Ampulex compressa]